VGSSWRLQHGSGLDQSLALASPYQPLQDAPHTRRAAPSRLLHPTFGVVPFTGRVELVNQSATWCLDVATRPRLAVHTVTGGGDSGKSRLAAEVCLTVTAAGWDAGVADFDAPGGTPEVDLDRPTLIVVDDADLHASQIARPIRSVGYGRVQVRLLLLARSRTPWWESLDTLTENALGAYDDGDLHLSQHPLGSDERLEHYRRALTAFRAALDHLATPI
jgi:hypothetical protein